MKYQIDEITSEQLNFCNKAKLIKCETHKQRLTSFDDSPNVNIQDRYLCEDCPKKDKKILSFKEVEDQIVSIWNKNVQKFNKYINELNLEQIIISLKKNLKGFQTQIQSIINDQCNRLNQILQQIEKKILNKIQEIQESMEFHDQVQQLKKENNNITRTNLQLIYKHLKSEQKINIQQKYFENINEILLKFEKNLHPFQQKQVQFLGQPILGIAISQDQNCISLVTHTYPNSVKEFVKSLSFESEINFVLELYKGGFRKDKEKILKNVSIEEIQSYQMKFSYDNKYIAVHYMKGLKCFDMNLKKVFTIGMTKQSQFVFTQDSKYMIIMFQEEEKETSSLRIIEVKKQENPNIKIIDLDGVSSDISLNKDKGTLAVLINKSLIKIFQQNMDQLTLLNTCNVSENLLKIQYDLNFSHLISINSNSIFFWDSDELKNPQAQPKKQIKIPGIVKITEQQIKGSCFINSDERFLYVSVPSSLKKHQIMIISKEGLDCFYLLYSQLDLNDYLKYHKNTIRQLNTQSEISCTYYFNAQPFCMKGKQLLVVRDKKIVIYSNEQIIQNKIK